MAASYRFLLSVSLLVAASGTGAAQEAPDPASARVRVHPSRAIPPFAGVLIRSTPDSLYLVRDGSVSPEPVALGGIRKLEQSRGRRSNLWRGALIGAIAGGGVGLGIGLAEPVLEEGAEESALIPVATATIGALAGGLVGGLIGSLSRSERWGPMIWAERVSQDPESRPGSASVGHWIGFGLGISVGRAKH